MDNRLPPIAQLTPALEGRAFYLCTRKESRPIRSGAELFLITLQDATGEIQGRLHEEALRLRDDFDAGEFVRVQARVVLFNGSPQLAVTHIRRVNPDQDRAHGFREDDCLPHAPRPSGEMWRALQDLIAARVTNPHIRALLEHVLEQHAREFQIWPAARSVHHAYRGGLLEHVLKMAETGAALAEAYSARVDLVVAGAVLHDIGKLRELDYELTTSYSREGNLVGHIVLGVGMVRDAAARIPGLPAALLTQIEHLIASHHGSREYGSPVEPMTVEALILSTVDQLDATLHQIRSHIDRDAGESEFTAYHARLGRVFFKGDQL